MRVVRRSGALELRVDGSLASRYVPGQETGGRVWDALAAPILWLPPERRRRLLVLGLGGGSAARLARALAPRAHIVGVELDGEVLRAARRWLDLEILGLEVVEGDALGFLRRARSRFDAILEDVFVGRGRAVRKPAWLPHPGLELAVRRLRPGGVLASNTLDEWREVERAVQGLLPRTVCIEVEQYDNRILVGGAAGLDARALRGRMRAEPRLAATLPSLSLRSSRA